MNKRLFFCVLSFILLNGCLVLPPPHSYTYDFVYDSENNYSEDFRVFVNTVNLKFSYVTILVENQDYNIWKVKFNDIKLLKRTKYGNQITFSRPEDRIYGSKVWDSNSKLEILVNDSNGNEDWVLLKLKEELEASH